MGCVIGHKGLHSNVLGTKVVTLEAALVALTGLEVTPSWGHIFSRGHWGHLRGLRPTIQKGFMFTPCGICLIPLVYAFYNMPSTTTWYFL
jgi:hypothetical protein